MDVAELRRASLSPSLNSWNEWLLSHGTGVFQAKAETTNSIPFQWSPLSFHSISWFFTSRRFFFLSVGPSTCICMLGWIVIASYCTVIKVTAEELMWIHGFLLHTSVIEIKHGQPRRRCANVHEKGGFQQPPASVDDEDSHKITFPLRKKAFLAHF